MTNSCTLDNPWCAGCGDKVFLPKQTGVRSCISAHFRSTRPVIVVGLRGGPAMLWGCRMAGGISKAAVSGARRRPSFESGLATPNSRRVLRAVAGNNLMELDKKGYTTVTAVAKATWTLFIPPAEGVTDVSVRTGRVKISDTVEQITLQLKQMRMGPDVTTSAGVRPPLRPSPPFSTHPPARMCANSRAGTWERLRGVRGISNVKAQIYSLHRDDFSAWRTHM